MTQAAFLALLAAVALGRLLELRLSARHLGDTGGSPADPANYRLMVGAHAGIIGGAALEVLLLERPWPGSPALLALAVVLSAAALRLWVIRSLGPSWNVRAAVPPDLAVVTGGPYRLLRHPNYLAVLLELAALPLVHGAWITALAGGALHLPVLLRRIRAEESGLSIHPAWRAHFADKPRLIPGIF